MPCPSTCSHRTEAWSPSLPHQPVLLLHCLGEGSRGQSAFQHARKLGNGCPAVVSFTEGSSQECSGLTVMIHDTMASSSLSSLAGIHSFPHQLFVWWVFSEHSCGKALLALPKQHHSAYHFWEGLLCRNGLSPRPKEISIGRKYRRIMVWGQIYDSKLWKKVPFLESTLGTKRNTSKGTGYLVWYQVPAMFLWNSRENKGPGRRRPVFRLHLHNQNAAWPRDGKHLARDHATQQQPEGTWSKFSIPRPWLDGSDVTDETFYSSYFQLQESHNPDLELPQQ